MATATKSGKSAVHVDTPRAVKTALSKFQKACEKVAEAAKEVERVSKLEGAGQVNLGFGVFGKGAVQGISNVLDLALADLLDLPWRPELWDQVEQDEQDEAP